MNSAEQQNAYRAKCTHYRNKHLVIDNKTDSVVFDGSKKCKTGLGINKAKNYVRTKGLKSFTVK